MIHTKITSTSCHDDFHVVHQCKIIPFKIESDVSAVLVRNRRAKAVNQSFSVEMLGCVGHWGGRVFNIFFPRHLKKLRKQYDIW